MEVSRPKRCHRKNKNERLQSLESDHLYTDWVSDEIGYGLFTRKKIEREEYIIEYKGEVLPAFKGDKKKAFGYLFYFQHNGKCLCIDAFKKSKAGLARYANDEWVNPNSRVTKEVVNGKPRLFLKAIKEINVNEEIRYDYNDKTAPWRKSKYKGIKTRKDTQDTVCEHGATGNMEVVVETGPIGSPGIKSPKDTQDPIYEHGAPENIEVVETGTTGPIGFSGIKSPRDTQDPIYEHGAPENIEVVETGPPGPIGFSYPLEGRDEFEDTSGYGGWTATPISEFKAETYVIAEQLNHLEQQNNLATTSLEESNPFTQSVINDMLPESCTEKLRTVSSLSVCNSSTKSSDDMNDTITRRTNISKKNATLTDIQHQEYDSESSHEIEELVSSGDSYSPESDCTSETESDEIHFSKKQFSAQKNRKHTSLRNKRPKIQNTELIVSSESDLTPVKKTKFSAQKNQKHASQRKERSEPQTQEPIFSSESDRTPVKKTRKWLQNWMNDSERTTEESKKSSEEHLTEKGKEKKTKPKRPCVYCGKFQAKLSRHLESQHKNQEGIKALKEMSSSRRLKELDKLKKEGIFKYNKRIIMECKPHSDLLSERDQGKNALKMCASCKGFFNEEFFYRHKLKCMGNSDSTKIVSIPISLLKMKEVNTFTKDIMSRFRSDEIGEICKTDPVIQSVGEQLFKRKERKKNKEVELRRTTMTSMRQLAQLSIAFKKAASEDGLNLSTSDMFNRKNFNYLSTAIEEITNKDDRAMYGKQLALGNLIKKVCKILKGLYLVEDEDSKADQIDRFVCVLELQWQSLFGSAEYTATSQRLDKIRRPSHLPDEEDIQKLRNFIKKELQEVMADPYELWGPQEYIKLRRLLVARLTLYNARRGGEPSRLLLKEWMEAKTGVWISDLQTSEVLDSSEKSLIDKLKLAYQPGKGPGQFVPVLIPDDCVEAMEKLGSEEVRSAAGVNPKNIFMFASIHHSNDHASGWHEVNSVKESAGVIKNLTATNIRHYVSTMYASLDIPQSERNAFYLHMGHSSDINQHVYQCPMSVQEVTKVGKFLEQVDQKSAADSCCGNDTDTGHSNEEVPQDSNSSVTETVHTAKYGQAVSSSNSNSSVTETVHTAKCGQAVPSSSGRLYNRWGEKNTSIVKKYFAEWIFNKDGTCRGKLPGKEIILKFLEDNKSLFKELSQKERVKLVRTKVFNEREKAKKRLDDFLD